jgi:hypothetical protein
MILIAVCSIAPKRLTAAELKEIINRGKLVIAVKDNLPLSVFKMRKEIYKV